MLISPPITGLATTTFSHRGKSDLAVWVYTNDGSADLLVNEIGKYEGEVPLPDGAAVLEVTAEGAWTATATQ